MRRLGLVPPEVSTQVAQPEYVSDYAYASGSDLLAAAEPLIVVLDEVTDPQNLGAVCRSAECAGATGLVV